MVAWRAEGVQASVKWLDVAAFLILAGWLAAGEKWSARFAVGMTLAVAAFATWMAARRRLGSSFAVKARAKGLVTTGLYARFRHPIYLFGQLAWLGLAIAWGRIGGFVCVALVAVVQVARVRKEQAVLEQAFGDDYRAWRSKTWF